MEELDSTSLKLEASKYTGQQFGELIFLGISRYYQTKTTRDRTNKVAVCACRCLKCTKISEYNYCNVINGRTKSCKICRVKNRPERKGPDAVRHTPYIQYKSKAKSRDLRFDITQEEFIKLIEAPCYYCGDKDTCTTITTSVRKGFYPPYKHNGVDRLDSQVGYTVENTVTSCKICNIMKNVLPKELFLAKVKQVYEYTTKVV